MADGRSSGKVTARGQVRGGGLGEKAGMEQKRIMKQEEEEEEEDVENG